ncbi:MAG: putative transrane protein of unknown function [Bacteroidota bacterium]|nr:putative transrane protein of unknown function [Bacteroidota bacterium]
MIQNLPDYVSIVFELTTLVTLILFYFAMRNASINKPVYKANIVLILLNVWLILQSILALKNFYNTKTQVFPPKFILAVFPALLTIIILFATKKGRIFIHSLPLDRITYINTVRIPVELVLYWLALHKAVPELMTFAGRNFDILAGITAPFVAYFAFRKNKLPVVFLLIWNFIALALLLNIIKDAILSAPFSFQRYAFDQPNIAVLNFPFSWLPSFIVPVIFFGHLVSITQLIKRINNKPVVLKEPTL